MESCGLSTTGLCRISSTAISIANFNSAFSQFSTAPSGQGDKLRVFAFRPCSAQSPAEIHASTGTALTDTATSPLAVNASAMTDGRGLDAATEEDVGGMLCAFKSVHYHKCSSFPSVL